MVWGTKKRPWNFRNPTLISGDRQFAWNFRSQFFFSTHLWVVWDRWVSWSSGFTVILSDGTLGKPKNTQVNKKQTFRQCNFPTNPSHLELSLLWFDGSPKKDLSGDWDNGEMQQKFDQLRERQKKVGVVGFGDLGLSSKSPRRETCFFSLDEEELLNFKKRKSKLCFATKADETLADSRQWWF